MTVQCHPYGEEFESRTTPAQVGALNVVLISDGVAQAWQIAELVRADQIAVVYSNDDMTTQGLVDLLSAVSRAHGDARIDHLALFAHGSPGRVSVGSRDVWSLDSLPGHGDEWRQLRCYLSDQARLDVYACSVAKGASGAAFVDGLASSTGAVVYASDNIVGSGATGDFLWEYATSADGRKDLLSSQQLESIPGLALLSVDLTYPNSGTFAVGQVIHITGTGSDSSGINRTTFELYKGVSAPIFVGTIFQGANGSGLTASYNWTVPTTLGGQSISGTDYKIKMIVWANTPPANSVGDFSTGSLTLQVSTARVPGIDVSHWQGTISWTQVNAAGVAFAFMKATEGVTYVDPTFVTNSAGSKQAGVMPGAYHYARPDLGNTAVAEANWFVNHASGTIGTGFLPPVVDVEGAALNLPSATLSAWVDAYLDQVQLLTGIRPLLYASQGYLTYINQDPNQTALWVARYNGQDPQTGSPGNVAPWPAGGWKVWQYSSTGTVSGISGNVDMDVFNGTYATMSAWLNAVWDTTAPKISGVYFDGSTWSPAFRSAAGNANYGYPAQTGVNQLTSLPWSTINTVYFKFSENVTIDSNDLGIRGINVANYSVASFSYDNVNFVAKWELSSPIDTDRILLDLDGDTANAVTDTAGNKLAGSWTEGVSTFPTAGTAGNDFKYRLVVAVGDADRNGQVRNADVNSVRANLFVDAGSGGYDIYRDIDGNGLTRNADVNIARSHLFVDPPTGPGPSRPGRGLLSSTGQGGPDGRRRQLVSAQSSTDLRNSTSLRRLASQQKLNCLDASFSEL